MIREELLDEIRAEVVSHLIEKTPWIGEDEIQRESSTLQNWSTGFGPFTDLRMRSFVDIKKCNYYISSFNFLSTFLNTH